MSNRANPESPETRTSTDLRDASLNIRNPCPGDRCTPGGGTGDDDTARSDDPLFELFARFKDVIVQEVKDELLHSGALGMPALPRAGDVQAQVKKLEGDGGH